MVKGIVLVKRKPGLTPAEFRQHYEEVHVPLTLSLFPTIRKYVRNYVATIAFPASVEEPEFDCITELWFDDMEDFQAMMDETGGGAVRAMAHSQKVFLDAAKTVYFLVEEVESQID